MKITPRKIESRILPACYFWAQTLSFLESEQGQNHWRFSTAANRQIIHKFIGLQLHQPKIQILCLNDNLQNFIKKTISTLQVLTKPIGKSKQSSYSHEHAWDVVQCLVETLGKQWSSLLDEKLVVHFVPNLLRLSQRGGNEHLQPSKNHQRQVFGHILGSLLQRWWQVEGENTTGKEQ